MNVIIYSKQNDIAKKLQQIYKNKDVKIYDTDDFGELHRLFHEVEPIDLFIKSKNVIPYGDFNFIKILDEFNHYFPCIYIDFDDEKFFDEEFILKKINSLPQRVPTFTHGDFIKNLVFVLKNKNINISCEERPMFSPNVNFVYEYLKSRKNSCVSLEELSLILWKTSNKNNKDTLYTYIHEIRKKLSNSFDKKEKLVRIKKGFYQLYESE